MANDAVLQGSTPIRVGIVGAGWGANHARVIHELASPGEVRVSALCSRRRERAAALAGEIELDDGGIEERWERLVTREDVDLVVVTAPDDLHHPVTMAAIGAGKHVFCDKPLALDTRQAAEMLAAATSAGVEHFTGFTWRFAPPLATIKRLIGQGTIGEVEYIDAHFRIGPPLPGKEWQLEPSRRRGGVFSNLGVHLIDLVRYLGIGVEGPVAGVADTGTEAWLCWGHGDGAAPAIGNRASVLDGEGTVHQVGWIQLEGVAAGGAGNALRARLQCSQQMTTRASDPVRVEVHGSEATAIGYANPLQPHTQRVVLVPRISADPEPVAELEYPGGPPAPPTAALPSGGLLRPTVRHLYESHIVPRLRAGTRRPDTPTFADGLASQRVLDAALESASTGAWVRT